MTSKKKGGVIVDLGNVIIAHWLSHITRENFDTIDYDKIPEVPGVFDSLKRINTRFGGNVTVVFKASDTAIDKIISWLLYRRFAARTGIPFERIVQTKSGRDKTPYMDQSSDTHYDTTVVVDDRLEVLTKFVGRVPNLFLFRPQRLEVEQFKNMGALPYVHVVDTWREIETVVEAQCK